MADRTVATGPVSAAGWRPQQFGGGTFRDVADPLIEPLWSGTRVLAHVAGGDARLVDEAGDEQPDAEVAAAVAAAVSALDAVIDGYLTSEAARTGEGIVLDSGIEAPGAMQLARQMLIGGSPDRTARVDEMRAREREAEAAVRSGEQPELEEQLVFVAVDLLALDGEPLLDVPLLERKRLLEAVVGEADLVRIGIHIRPPIDPWIATWRSLGFRSVAYKAANSRYRPGEPNDAWATLVLPTR
jgi:ATP-dependent DNA ligase